MRNICIPFLFILISFSAKSQVHQWSRLIGGTGSDVARTIAVDTAENIFVAGAFSDTVDFNTSPGIHVADTHISQGGKDMYISKYSNTGDHEWTITLGGSGDDIINQLIIGQNANSIVIIGSFSGTVDFDPSTLGNTIKTSSGGADAFMALYDLNGNFERVLTCGGPGEDEMVRTIVNPVDQEYLIAGTFQATADLDPDEMNADNHTSNGEKDIFLSSIHFDNWLYSAGKTFGGTDADDIGGLAVDEDGNYYVCGIFLNEVNFDPGSTDFIGTSNGAQDGFLIKYNPYMEVEWLDVFGTDKFDALRNLAIGGNALFVVGEFWGVINAAGDTYTTNGFTDIALLKYDLEGNDKRLIHIGGSSDERIYGIFVDDAVNITITGAFEGANVDFNPLGPEPFRLTSVLPYLSTYIAQYDSAGLLRWAGTFGTTDSHDGGLSVAVNESGQIIMAGYTVNDMNGEYYANPYYEEPISTLHMRGLDDGVLSVYVSPSNKANITYFNIPRQVGSTIIDSVNNTVTVTMPNGTDITALEPFIVSSLESHVNSATSKETDFTLPVIYMVTAQDGVTKKIWIATVVFGSTGFEEQIDDEFVQVYPNPAQNKVIVSTPAKAGTICIFNQNGICLLSQDYTGNNQADVSLGAFAPGVYFIYFISDRVVYKKKLIVSGQR